MKVMRVSDYGGPEAMKMEELPDPKPGPGQALVKIAACGVNFVDIYQRSGAYKLPLPLSMGQEGAGVVEAVGAGVSEVRAGDRVAWTGIQGSYATHVVAPAARLVGLPSRLTFNDGAAAMLQGMTAHYLVNTTYTLKRGDTCLIHAAAGGVGLLLCQMAKRAGARVIGTASTEQKAKLAREAGADEVILYSQSDFEPEVKRLTEGRGLQVVYDSVGKDTFERSLNCLVPRGYLVLFGQSSGPVSAFDPQVLNAKGSLFLTRPSLGHYTATREELLRRSGEVLGWAASGQLKLRIEKVLPLGDAAEAHRLLAGRLTTGKLLLLP
ncbi:MAG: quinone oxidoreductase [Dehalococcoidia bacterium]|nr:quinone oxidoreductase [Dehalococcoidia bacterium]